MDVAAGWPQPPISVTNSAVLGTASASRRIEPPSVSCPISFAVSGDPGGGWQGRGPPGYRAYPGGPRTPPGVVWAPETVKRLRTRDTRFADRQRGVVSSTTPRWEGLG